MIQLFCEKLIEELGASGLLVLGLYFILYKPMRDLAYHIKIINDELGQIAGLYKEEIQQKHHNK